MAAPLALRSLVCGYVRQKPPVAVKRTLNIFWKPQRGYAQQQEAVASTSAAAAQTQGKKWQLIGAVCLQRMPIITSPLNALEEEFSQLMQTLEDDCSRLSKHEMRHLDDLKLAERRRQEDYEETEAEAIRQTAEEAEDAWEAELHNFVPADRETEADKNGDLMTSDRKLWQQLTLLVKQNVGDREHWCLPQVPHQPGESMRECAERALQQLCGTSLQAQFMGNAPTGFYSYEFPVQSEAAQQFVGAKVFFFKAQLIKGAVQLPENTAVSQFNWVTRRELKRYNMKPDYRQQLYRFIQLL